MEEFVSILKGERENTNTIAQSVSFRGKYAQGAYRANSASSVFAEGKNLEIGRIHFGRFESNHRGPRGTCPVGCHAGPAESTGRRKDRRGRKRKNHRSEEHTSELQSR